MTPRLPPFNAAWFDACGAQVLLDDGGVRLLGLTDPADGSRWVARSASLSDTAACEPLQREARLASRLSPSPVAKVWAPDRMVLVMEAGRGVSPASAMRGTLSIPAFLDVAVHAAAALMAMHGQRWIHGDLRPPNLLVDDQGGVRLVGFGQGFDLSGEEPAVARGSIRAWSHEAPELGQEPAAHPTVGTDLYALGVVFYELLTGALPLSGVSVASWRHAHAAIEPAPVQARRADVPEQLGRIVAKLLAKSRAGRHPSAHALLADLQRCRDDWRRTGTVEMFDLEAAGSVARLPMPGRLYGRAADLAVLSQALERVTSTGRSELVLVSGASGSGKSALVHWLLDRAAGQGLRTAEGKSDAQQRDIPFGPVVRIVRTLARGVLDQGEAGLAPVRQRWLDALHGQGRALVELVPDVERVLGPTPALAEVSAAQGRVRMETALLRTFSALGGKGTPLLLFLDDLQWADESTMSLLEAMVADAAENLLVIGALRSHASTTLTRLAALQHVNRSRAIAVTRLEVAPLTVPQVVDLVATALGTSDAAVESVASAIHRRTEGNPFHAYQLLQAWVDDGTLSRDAAAGRWRWRADAEAGAHSGGEQVADLMVRRFAILSPAGTALLADMACVGVRCDDALLARMAGRSAPDVVAALQPFVDAGLLVREAGAHAFHHDRVLESAYSLIAAASRPAAHARVARVMIEHWASDPGARAFEVCNQIERAEGLALSEDDRALFAGALLRAGRRARAASLVDRAAAYGAAAAALMSPSWWTDRFALAHGVSLLRCECLFAQADLPAAERELGELLARDLPPLERAEVHRLEAVLHTVRSDYERAIDAALQGLSLLGVELKRHPAPREMRAAYEAVKAALGERSVASLGELPETKDPNVQAAMGLLSTLVASLFVADGINFVHAAKIVSLSLEHGATAQTPYGLSWFGVFVASLYGEYEEGRACGEAALALVDRRGFETGRVATLLGLDQVAVWTKPLDYSLGHAKSAVAQGLASGDIGMACYACNHIVSDLLVMGEALPLVEEEIERGLALTRAVQYLDIELILLSQRQFVHLLRQGTVGEADGARLHSWSDAVVERAGRSRSQPTSFFVWLYGGLAAAYLGEWGRAVDFLSRARTLSWSAPAHINVADCHLYGAIARARAPSEDTASAVQVLHDERERFARWAGINPPTFQSKLLLIDAELARLEGDPLRALVSLERSAAAAAAAGFIHEQALAHEFAAQLCHAQSLPTAAGHHARLAHAACARWGARGKARALPVPAAAPAPGAPGPHLLPAWELGAKAAQVLSEEAVMDRLIETLMTDVLVHAGARYGLLLLMHEGEPRVEASARVVGAEVVVELGSAKPGGPLIPAAILQSVLRTRQALVLADAQAEASSLLAARGGSSPLRSVACLPLLRGGALMGAIYLENNLAPGVFDEARLVQLEMMAPQVAIALETARLYQQVLDESARRLAAEVNLRNARAELVKNAQLTLLANLSASIAHEVNQPLASVVTSADASLRWLDRPVPDIAEVEAGLRNIRQEGQRAGQIIRALRSLARQAPSQWVPLWIDDLVADVLSMVHLDIEARGIQLTTHLAAAVWVDGDRIQLQQVVLNLVTNALDAMDGTPQGQRHLAVVSEVDESFLVVRVMDRGAGIPPGAADRLFEPFFTTKADGLGMGLAICRNIAEAHGGRLQARSRDAAGGAEFELRVPLSSSGEPAPARR